MDNQRFMKLAIDKAYEGVEKGQEPFGACIVKDGKVISVCHNTVYQDMDVTAHAEMNAIRKACKKINSVDLSGCDIYATFKPCPMCNTACDRANISKIYYGAGPDNSDYQKKVNRATIVKGFMKNDCLKLLKYRIVRE
jgi:tRNA(Arg) A34 adenosine deaminase TadA